MAQPPADRPPSLKVLAEPPPTPAPDHDATYLDRLVNLGLLNVYGFGGVMSRRVRADVAFAGMLILIQAGIDFMAWFLGMKLVFVPGFGFWLGLPLALVFASMFAATIAIFERSVLTADVGLRGLLRNGAIYFRMVFVLLASLVTAVPLELFLFADEINAVIDRDRSSQLGRARDLLRANVDALLTAHDGKLDKDLARLETQFAPLRAYGAPATSSVSPRLVALERQIEKVTDAMQQEEEGNRSGAYGRGKRYKSLEGKLDTLNRQLTLIQTQHDRELLDLRKDAQERHTAGESAFQQAVTALRGEHDKGRAALLGNRSDIDLLEERTLAARARVTIDVPEGFSARVRILHVMAAKEETVEWGIWALRMVMVLFGLLVLIQKATFSTETKAYFSSMAHAAQGDVRLRRLFAGLTRVPDMSDKDRKAMHAVSRDDGKDA